MSDRNLCFELFMFRIFPSSGALRVIIILIAKELFS